MKALVSLSVILFSLTFALNAQNRNDVRKTIKDADNLTEKGKIQTALSLFLKTDSLLNLSDLSEDEESAIVKGRIASLYSYLNQEKKATEYYVKAITLYRENDYDIYEQLMLENELSSLYAEQGLYEAAIKNVGESFESIEEYSLGDTFIYYESLLAFSEIEISGKRYQSADSALSIIMEGCKDPDIRKYIDYFNFLELRTGNLLYSDRPKEALESAVQYLEYAEKSKGKKSTEFGSALGWMGEVYMALYDYSSAEQFLRKALEIEEEAEGDNSNYYLYYLDRLSELYKEKCFYRLADSVQQVIIARKFSTGEDASDNHLELADIAMNMADFEKASSYVEKYREYAKSRPFDHISYSLYLNLSANLHTLTGNYPKALKSYLEILDTDKKWSMENTEDHAINLKNLANLYYRNNEFINAETFAEESLGLYRKLFGNTNPNTASSMVRLAEIKLMTGKIKEAESLVREAISIQKSTLGEENTEYGAALNTLAEIEIENGNYKEAESTIRKASLIFRKLMGPNHPYVTNKYKTLGSLHYRAGETDSADIYFVEYNKHLLKSIKKEFSFLSGRDKDEYLKEVNYEIGELNSYYLGREDDSHGFSSYIYNNQLAIKGISLYSSASLRRAVISLNDKSLTGKYNRINELHDFTLKQESLPLANRLYNTDSLRTLIDELESELIKSLRAKEGYSQFTGLPADYTWQDVQNNLSENEAAIEFTVTPEFDEETGAYSNYYSAMVVMPHYSEPIAINLFYESELTEFLQKNRAGNDAAAANRIYTKRVTEDELDSDNLDLYWIVWAKIEDCLGDIKNVYYSPDGLLHNISFDAIPFGQKECLSDRYSLFRVSSTREVIEIKRKSRLTSLSAGIVLFGGINYNADLSKSKLPEAVKPEFSEISRSFQGVSAGRNSSFLFLEGTLREVNRIVGIMQSDSVSARIYTGDTASEQNLKLLNGPSSPSVIHIATHGFSIGRKMKEGADGEQGPDSDPLMRTGLILAGGNETWVKKVSPEGYEDGILLAAEVAQMFLPNTSLAVLSACNTGLGDIIGAEGVYGLQRAFKMAGVTYQLLSLWEVPDYQTSELMEMFYANLARSKDCTAAFRDAQKIMKQKYPGTPSVWAAFTLTR